MINNYMKPQLLIKQLLEVLPDAGDSFLNACIIGPQYDLMRVGNKDEKALMNGAAFAYNEDSSPAARQLLEYENLSDGAVVDLDSVKVYGENLEAQIAVFGETPTIGAGQSNDYFLVNNLKTPNKLRFVNDDAAGDLSGLNLTCAPDADGAYPDIHPSLYGAPVVPGDLAYVTVDGEVVRRVVRSIEQEEAPSSFGTDSLVSDGNAANAESNPVTHAASTPGTPDVSEVIAPAGITVPATLAGWDRLAYGAKYLNKYGDRYIVTVTKSASHNGTDATADVNGEVKIRTTSGTFSADDVVLTASGAAQTFTFDLHGVSVALSSAATETVMGVGNMVSFTVLADYQRLDTTGIHELAISGTYTGKQDTTYIMKVVTGTATDAGFAGAVIEVTDTAGADQVLLATLPASGKLNLGTLGLQFEFVVADGGAVQNGLRKGDVYYVNAKAAAKTGAYSLLVLNGAVTDTIAWSEADRITTPIKVEFRKTFTGFVNPKGDKAPVKAYEATADGVYMTYGLTVQDARRTSSSWLPVQDSSKSKLFVQYRAFAPAGQNEPYRKIRSATDITKYFGKVDLDNPVAYGCQQALGGSQGKPIYAIRVPSDDIAGYTEALRILEGAPLFYALSVMTYDVDVQKALQSHVEAQSNDDVKKWRRGYVGCETPSEFAVMQKTSEGASRTATITADEEGYLRVFDEDGEFMTYGIRSGDLYRTSYTQNEWGDEVFSGYEIKEVNSEEELILKVGPNLPINPAARYEIWRDDSAQNITDYVAAISSQFGSRRMVNVWCDTPLMVDDDSGLVEIPTYYGAAEVAGLRSAVLPQQGLTRTEITFTSSVPSMYTKYTEAQLDEMAANGTFIVVQEIEDGPIFIRHQLTTNTNNGAMFYEDSVGTNFDNICYDCKGVLDKYIGKRNTTQSTLQDIYDDIRRVLRSHMDSLPGTNLGAALIEYSDLRVWVDPVMKDRVNAYAKLVFPLPINTLELTLNATASFNDVSISEIEQ